jgi:predicted lipase
MSVHPLKIHSNPLQNAHTLGVITHATLWDDPFDTYPVLHDLFSNITTFEVEAHWGMVVSNRDYAVLAFRGTDSNLEWAHTFTYRQNPWITGKAHAGFVQALDLLWENVMAALYDAHVIDEEKTLWVTGHSLGGALALLAANRLDHIGIKVHEVQTFGTPQVLDPVAANAYPIPVRRFINNEDPIPQTSWPTLFDTYAHVGEEYFLLASGALAENRHSRDLSRKIDRAYSIGEGIFPAGMIHDHFMKEYLKKLRDLDKHKSPARS